MNIKKYDWIDALRGYAIILVLLVHVGQLFSSSSYDFNFLTKNGDLGVTLFFITSSFTLFNSFKKRKESDGKMVVKFFYIRRFFRIAPLYYIAIIFYAYCYNYHLLGHKENLSYVKVFTSVLFLNGIYLPAINYIPPGSWSVGNEMIFYLILPLLYAKIKNFKTAIKLLVFTISISFIIQIALYIFIENYTHHPWLELRGWVFYFWFPNQLPVFCFGICLYFFEEKYRSLYSEWMLFLTLAFILLLSSVTFKLTFPRFLLQREYIFSIAFCAFAFCLSKTKFKVLKAYIDKIGQLSFSIYLNHFIVLYGLSCIIRSYLTKSPNQDLIFLSIFVSALAICYFIAFITYNLIEKRGILFGEAIIENIKRKPIL